MNSLKINVSKNINNMEDEKKGVVAGLNERGFGFIVIKGRKKDLFFHAQALVGVDFKDLKNGDEVVFGSIEDTAKGEQAQEVSLA